MTTKTINIAFAIAVASLVALTTVDAEAKSARAKVAKGITLSTQSVQAGDCGGGDPCSDPNPPPSCDNDSE